MTREEAIKRLKEYAQYSYGIWHNDEEDTKAFDMAIEALSAEPSDLISRADTLAKIKEYCIDGDSVVHKWFDTMGIEEVINTMPSVSAERVGEWEYDFDKDDHYCTRCHKYAGDWEMNLLSDYCPSCGARMENTK